MNNPTAFISYARRDDKAYGDRITRLGRRLQGMVAAAIGRDFDMFQDCEGIAWGQHWPARLDEALNEALFLIPILTPSYFNSGACRAELESFLELERRSGRMTGYYRSIFCMLLSTSRKPIHLRQSCMSVSIVIGGISGSNRWVRQKWCGHLTA